MNYILFSLIFIYLTNWQVVISLFKGLFFSRTKSFYFKDENIFKFLQKKTGLKFKFKKAIAHNYSGFSLLYPPQTIVLSSKILKDFSRDELDWVILHEAAHALYKHGLKYIPISLSLIVIGIFILHRHNIFFPIVTITLTIIYQQIIRVFETQADTFAVKNMDNPRGMISANKKFEKASRSIIYKNDLLRTLFTPHLSWRQRIKMAEEELVLRKN